MENNSGVSSSTPSQEPTATEARRALEALATDRGVLADRMVTPAWYHPTLAALVFVLVAGYGFQRLFLIALVFYSAGLVALVTAYRRITGVWSSNVSRIGARRYVVGLAIVLIVCLGLSNAARSGAVPWWWALVAGVVSGLGALWVGPRFDVALRQSLRVTR